MRSALLRHQTHLARQELLIVDELGFVPLSKTGAEMLFEVFSQRYERSSTLVTSNLPFAEWTEVLPFLLTLYSLFCYGADSKNRYSPEDALLPGSYPQGGTGTAGLRCLLCYESDNEVCDLQKGAPKHWFAAGERIFVQGCPTRFGALTGTTEAVSSAEWHIEVTADDGFAGKLFIDVHAPG